MFFNDHSKLRNQHAILSPSKYHWIRYSDEKFQRWLENRKAVEVGTELHALSSGLIKHGIKLPKDNTTISLFVNDAIKMGLSSEVVLRYSEFAFGTADAIGIFQECLHIHDLKTGTTKGSLDQLKVYAALFLLEYPTAFNGWPVIKLRIYQDSEVLEEVHSTPEEIFSVMDKIVKFDLMIRDLSQ